MTKELDVHPLSNIPGNICIKGIADMNGIDKPFLPDSVPVYRTATSANTSVGSYRYLEGQREHLPPVDGLP